MPARTFLDASMPPDPELAATNMSDDVVITFTGGRYNWVKKALGQFDACDKGDHVVVYSNGTLHGEWPDGQHFSGNRYLNRFEV